MSKELASIPNVQALVSSLAGYLGQFDAGIAPTLEDVVNAYVADGAQWSPHDIRTTATAMATEGIVRSRWDGDGYVFYGHVGVGTRVVAGDMGGTVARVHASPVGMVDVEWDADSDGGPYEDTVWIEDVTIA